MQCCFPAPSAQDVNNPGTTFADTLRRRYCGAGPAITNTSYAELKTMMVSYQSNFSSKSFLPQALVVGFLILDLRTLFKIPELDGSRTGVVLTSQIFGCIHFTDQMEQLRVEILPLPCIMEQLIYAPIQLLTEYSIQNAEWIPANDIPGTSTHGDGISYNDFAVWNSRNYQNSLSYERIIKTRLSSETNQLNAAKLPSWMSPDENIGWVQTSRIEGWSLSSPHKSFIDGHASSFFRPNHAIYSGN